MGTVLPRQASLFVGVFGGAGLLSLVVGIVRNRIAPVRHVLAEVDMTWSGLRGLPRAQFVSRSVQFRGEDGSTTSYYAMTGALAIQKPGTIGVAVVRARTLLAFEPLEPESTNSV
jgi:hypothetical protein